MLVVQQARQNENRSDLHFRLLYHRQTSHKANGCSKDPSGKSKKYRHAQSLCDCWCRFHKKSGICRFFYYGCGGRIRTSDLRVMSPTSYQLLHSASTCFTTSSSHDLVSLMVLVAGLEPARILVRRILSPLRLPVPPHEQAALVVRSIMIARVSGFVKSIFWPIWTAEESRKGYSAL